VNLFYRLVRVLLGILWSTRRLGVHDPSVLEFRVWPNDLDLNRHMNNGRYLTVMDLGRIDLIGRMGLIATVREQRWFPVLGSAVIRYHRPLAFPERYTLVTRIVGWDEKWFYLSQMFTRGGTPVASAFAKGLVRAPGRSIPTGEVLAAAGITEPSPPLPEPIVRWLEADASLASPTPGPAR